MDLRPKTVFCDIDGTLVKHAPPHISSQECYEMEVLKGTLEKLLDWDKKGYNIILTTGRKESLRRVTELQLSKVGIFYDQLIMGIGGGHRILINDCKDSGDEYATAINVKRNTGIKDIEI